MSEIDKHYPLEENLGNECMFWHKTLGCKFPRAEITGRRSCEGVIDDVCLLILHGRRSQHLSPDQIIDIKTRQPGTNLDLPPGQTK